MGIHCTRLHDDPKPWRCSRCEYRARSRCIVRYHEEQVHERRRPFRCETCGLAVVSRRVLAIHRVVHSPDPTPYRCDRCAYATRFLSNLTKHMIVHTDAKPFECSTCNMRFARKANLKTHVNKAHRLLDVSLAFHPSNNDLLEHNIDAILSEEASTFKEDLNVGRINGVQQTLRQKAINKILKSVPGITVPVQALAGESGIEKMFESTRNCGVILQTEEVDEIVLDNPTQLKTVIDVLGTVTERAVVQLPAMALVSIMINGEISCVS
ncbi:zinc finger protein 493-like [Varroa jacobsoni]|nr:zinc finger protein 493-like [Varroa jacobsoni]